MIFPVSLRLTQGGLMTKGCLTWPQASEFLRVDATPTERRDGEETAPPAATLPHTIVSGGIARPAPVGKFGLVMMPSDGLGRCLRPVATSKAVSPSTHRSTPGPYGSWRRCSGAQYILVPALPRKRSFGSN